MNHAVTTWNLTRERNRVRQRIAELEPHLDRLVDREAGTRELADCRNELVALEAALLDGNEVARPAAPPQYRLRPAQAADILGMDRRELLRLVDLTPPHLRPCKHSPGGIRRHLRFDHAQLIAWAKEKPWQASAPIRPAGSSAGANPPRLTLVPAPSGPGCAPSPRPARRSTARTRSAPSRLAHSGCPLTGDPDLDSLV